METCQAFPRYFSRKVGSLGERVGTYPRAFASVSFLIALFLATGLQRFKYITDNELLFVPHNSPGMKVCKFLLLSILFQNLKKKIISRNNQLDE